MSEATRQRTVKYGLNAGLLILIVAGILVAANVISARVFTRMDLTEGKEFTVSDSSKKILRELEDVVNVKVFFSEKLPPQLTTLKQNVADVLKEYEVHSRGNVRVRFIDPGEDEDLRQQAQNMGIPQLQMNLLEKDQYQVTNVFLGIGLQYGDQTEALPVVQDLDTFEYDMTSAIVKLTQNEQRTIGVLSGFGSRDINTDLTGINQILGKIFQIRSVSLNDGRVAVPEDIDALLVAGPKNVPERVAYQLDQYVMRGGKVIFLIDPVQLNEQAGLAATPVNSGLNDLLSFYGAGIRSALVMETQQASAMASFSQGFMSYVTPYPFWAKVSGAIYPDALNPRNPITSDLESVTFTWAAPVDLGARLAESDRSGADESGGGKSGGESGDGNGDGDGDGAAGPENGNAASGTKAASGSQPGVEGMVLARTTNLARLQTGRYDLSPQNPALQTRPLPGETDSYPLAVALTGRFQSFYSDKAVPPVPSNDPEAPAAASDEQPLLESPETQMIIAGNSQFVADQTLRMFPENVLFIQNAIDWMTLGDDLISIRSRGATERPIRELADGQKTAVRYGNTFGVSALVILFGLVRHYTRRKSRERLAETYAA